MHGRKRIAPALLVLATGVDVADVETAEPRAGPIEFGASIWRVFCKFRAAAFNPYHYICRGSTTELVKQADK